MRYSIARRSNASAVLAVVILSVCLSVRLCVTRVLRDKTKKCTADILTPHERAVTLVFWHQQWLVGDALFRLKFALKVTYPFEKRRLWQISAYNVSTVRNSEKSSIMTNRKSTTGFPTSYRRSAYIITKSQKGGSKGDFLFFKIIFNFNRIKSATKFLCVKTSNSMQSCSITIP